MLILLIVELFLGCATVHAEARGGSLVVNSSRAGAFALVDDGSAAPIVYDPADHAVVAHAARSLASDIAAVTSVEPLLISASGGLSHDRVVIVGTLGRSGLIDALATSGKVDPAKLRGSWETFQILVVRAPLPGVDEALVIIGSDRRGTAFGVFELSEEIGVSPWFWWADVPAQRRQELHVMPGTRSFGPPSVKYRGIFINDEDWGLHPWAARNYEPEAKGIGPKTYRRVFELLLRLKANSLWPAMHKVSAPFNGDPANTRLADEFGIVMGSSHAEPMLRNNVAEWRHDPELFNFAANRHGVLAYWAERVRSNARYENMWTLGMRGIHDSGMIGVGTPEEGVRLLESIFSEQRALLRDHVNPKVEQVPQVFVPYKEVLPLYRAGLKVPDDVTIVWPDDNFGYIRRFPHEAERRRPGGSGVYYHLSYLGAPMAYLWLSTTPPVLIQEEMTRAWDLGARDVWIANVGDIKPAEIGMTLFLEMAWDIEKWRGRTQRDFLQEWSWRTFGRTQAQAIGRVLDGHFRANFERRPEHLQWWLPGEKVRASNLSQDEIRDRLAQFDELVSATRAIVAKLPSDQADSFFQLVEYPVLAAAAANRRYFGAEQYARLIDARPEVARAFAGAAGAADQEVKVLTRRFDEIAGGKWRYLINEEPADNQWRTFRISPLAVPAPALQSAPAIQGTFVIDDGGRSTVDATSFRSQRGWRLVQGLGRGTGSMAADREGAAISYRITIAPGSTKKLLLGLVPNFPGHDSGAFRAQVSVKDGQQTTVTVSREAGTAEWAAAVLDNRLLVPVFDLGPGTYQVVVRTDDIGLTIDGLVLDESKPGEKLH